MSRSISRHSSAADQTSVNGAHSWSASGWHFAAYVVYSTDCSLHSSTAHQSFTISRAGQRSLRASRAVQATTVGRCEQLTANRFHSSWIIYLDCSWGQRLDPMLSERLHRASGWGRKGHGPRRLCRQVVSPSPGCNVCLCCPLAWWTYSEKSGIHLQY